LGIISAAIYGASMMILYAGSTIYHALPVGEAKKRARVFDHCSIFILIAGTYTPCALVTLRQALPWLGWTVFGFVWGGALLGIILNCRDLKRFSKFSMACYIALGWCGLLSGYWLVTNLNIWGLVLILAGGILYTVGAVLYGLGKKRSYIHSVWHLFVLAASAAFFFSIYFFIL
jgi:hemolysin III